MNFEKLIEGEMERIKHGPLQFEAQEQFPDMEFVGFHEGKAIMADDLYVVIYESAEKHDKHSIALLKEQDENDLLALVEEKGHEKVDDIVTAMDDMGVDTEVLSSGENFNVAFMIGDTEYYVRPNDKGSEAFYIDADIDDFETFKVKDLKALQSKVKSMVKDK